MIPRRLLFLSPLIACLFPIALAQKPAAGTRNESKDGVRIAVFQAKPGEIRVALPDDMAAGDIISGTVSAEPSGVKSKEKEKNARELSGYVVELEKQKTAVSGGVLQGIHLAAGSGAPLLILLNGHGKQIGDIPVALQPSAPVALDSVRFGPIGEVGRPIQIQGPFGGDSSATAVSVGGASAKAIAESPRTLVVENPVKVPGPTQIAVTQNGVQLRHPHCADRPDRAANISLEGRTCVQVSGLEGITQPVPIKLRNESPSTVNLTGGETQNIAIDPSQVTAGGVFTSTYALTGVRRGSFNIVAKVVAG